MESSYCADHIPATSSEIRSSIQGIALAAALALSVTACATPAEKFEETAASLELRREVIGSAEFQHALYRRDGNSNRTLHIYLDGDGLPFMRGRPSRDPTPRNPLMLRLLALDPGPAVYVGRPCYHGFARTPPCGSELWTGARYSERVVSALVEVISRITAEAGYERISLFGHSGGGALATLLAPRLRQTKAVVTIAANLDIDAWADHHSYARLKASLNPAEEGGPDGFRGVVRRHYAGSRDAVVPPDIAARGINGQGAQLRVIEDYDHVCCWTDLWPGILADIEAAE